MTRTRQHLPNPRFEGSAQRRPVGCPPRFARRRSLNRNVGLLRSG
jgi:hypothetical protein